jgi:predicted Zn-dependent protease
VKTDSIFRCGAGLLLAVALSAQLPAQQATQPQPEKKQHSLSEKTGEALKGLTPLTAEKKFDEALKLIDGALATAAPDSYDRAFLQDIKAKIYLGMDKLAQAIGPWEEAINLHAQHQYFDEKYANDILLFLAQLVFGEAVALKDPAQQQQQLGKAAGFLKRHLDSVKKPSADTLMFYAQLLYQQAAADPKNIDQAVLKQAREVVERGLMGAIQPKENLYKLYLAILQQQNETAQSVDVLELLTKRFPTQKDYWGLLMATYLNLAGTESEKKQMERSQEYLVRAINTIERAQSLGFMKEPKDNYNLFSIYSMVGQIGKASDILHAGLKNNGIESTVANWRYLGEYYRQSGKDLQAIEALKEAQKAFPQEGMLDFQIGEIYRGMERTKEARDLYKTALVKGKLEKPLLVWQLLAYASMELDDLTEAQRAINEAAKLPDFSKDSQLVQLKDHIQLLVEEKQKAKEAAAKQATKG